jgi:hypothetical protein
MSIIAVSRFLKSGTSLGIALGAAFLASCAGGSSVLTRAASPAALPAAVATGCIYPATASQTVALPSAGGVSGTISLAPFARASSTCVGVTVATGSDATLTGTFSLVPDAADRRSALSATPSQQPIAQIELTNAFSGTLTPLTISLTVPASVPDGHYPATITTTIDLGDGQTSTSVANYTLTVVGGKAVLTGPSLPQALSVINADTSGLLSIYPAGTVLPTASPSPLESESPSPSPSAAPTVKPTTNPTANPTAKPTATPSPTPTPVPSPVSTTLTCSTYPYESSCGTWSTSGYIDGGIDNGQHVIASPQPVPATDLGISIPQWFVGTLTIALTNVGNGFTQTLQNDEQYACPSTFLTQSGAGGDTYTFNFPANGQEFNLPLESETGYGYACSLEIDTSNASGAPSIGIYLNVYTSVLPYNNVKSTGARKRSLVP